MKLQYRHSYIKYRLLLKMSWWHPQLQVGCRLSLLKSRAQLFDHKSEALYHIRQIYLSIALSLL